VDQLRVAYQPIVTLSTGAVHGVEALVRWEHPERGLLLAGEFVSDATNSGMIEEIDCWIAATALTQLAEWRESRKTRSIETVWVNVSRAALTRPAFLRAVDQQLQSTNQVGGNLGVEVTEAVLSDPRVEPALISLREIGVQLGVDDFGTGYSSLSHLRDFPLNVLKIDGGFIEGLSHDAATTAIVKAVIDLAHSLGMEATAEGVETIDQLEALRELGCDSVSGFLLCPPLPAAELARRVADGPLA
jgi:EAL domain-containing protein (putative c-di-GMP-specific phosphodiesterase class I)